VAGCYGIINPSIIVTALINITVTTSGNILTCGSGETQQSINCDGLTPIPCATQLHVASHNQVSIVHWLAMEHAVNRQITLILFIRAQKKLNRTPNFYLSQSIKSVGSN
jgi:hypothetical protein